MRRQPCMAQVVSSVMITVCVLAVPALAQDCPELVGRWPYGPAGAVAVSGDYVYFGSGTSLMVTDVSNPDTPQPVGNIEVPSIPQAIVASGGHAYVADWNGGLRVVDVNTPSAPARQCGLRGKCAIPKPSLTPPRDARPSLISIEAIVNAFAFLYGQPTRG